jgi:hypothetical protein
MIRFIGNQEQHCGEGKVIYLSTDHAFQTTPSPPFWSSLEVNTLELVLDVTGRVTGVWGYCPRSSWKQTKLLLPKASVGSVICTGFPNFQDRISRAINNNPWEVCVDNTLGWVCIGKSNANSAYFEVLNGFFMGIKDSVLQSFWLKIEILH